MYEKIRPLYDRVLVEIIEEENKTPSGIYLGETQDKSQKGLILSIGSGRLTAEGVQIPLQVHVGDTVFFGKFAGTEAGKNHLIIKEEEILGVFC